MLPPPLRFCLRLDYTVKAGPCLLQTAVRITNIIDIFPLTANREECHECYL